jgi:hypothetical protein
MEALFGIVLSTVAERMRRNSDSERSYDGAEDKNSSASDALIGQEPRAPR